LKLKDYSADSVLRAAMHGSTDFPNLTADVANKSLQRGYGRVPASWKPLARRNDAPDFKRINRPRIGAAPKMERLPQGAEIRHGTVGETGESWSLLTYAKAVTLTRQAIINDDTDALDRLPSAMGAQTAELESDIVWSLITSNPIMAEDGTALFHSDHNNLETGAGSAFSEDALSKARENMRLQVDLNGETQINVNPRWLVVPPQLETKAQKQTASVNPNAADDVNPFASQFQGVIVEARLAADSATAWYLAADPTLVEMIEYGTLQGNSGPVIESRDSWTHDGVEFRGIYDFGAGVLDFRGLHKSAGV
ncbi:MAG: peptidase U37, partial [Planctomycetota bacterium]